MIAEPQLPCETTFGSFCSSATQDRILTVYSNDAPGFRPEVLEQPGFLRILPKIARLVPDTSVIGMLLSHKSSCSVVKSSAAGILQHDGFSWEVLRDRFVGTELSSTGKLLERIFDSWIDGMDDETRGSLTDTVFSIIESTGMDTFHEMSQQKRKAADAILTSLLRTPADRKKELLKLTGDLIRSGGQAVLEQMKDALDEKSKEL